MLRRLLSARRNQVGKHFLVLAIVKAIRELVQVEGQILFAYVVTAADDPALQKCPE
jgi:hypothetical protein